MPSTSTYFTESHLLWKPTLSAARATATDRFRQFVNRKRGLQLADYHALHKYSVEEYSFWVDLWEFLGIISSVPPGERIIKPSSNPQIPIWFPDARLNYAENLLFRRDDAIAITAGGEPSSAATKHYTYRELHALVRQMARAMRVSGLYAGDRVAAVLANKITAVVIALAATSLGAIFTITGPDIGVHAILDRYKQIQPKVLFVEAEMLYGGKVIDLRPKAAELIRTLREHGLDKGVVVGDNAGVEHSLSLTEFLSLDDKGALVFEQLPFSHPLFILFSSGTSGPPKCIVHSAGGILLQQKKELRLNFGVAPDDVFFQYTSTSWMVWNIMLVNLANGTRVVLYDGSPFYPDMRALLRFADEQGVTMLGTSPRFLGELRGQGITPDAIGAKFESLRTLSSTGAVLTPAMFAWTQRAFGDHVHLTSSCGGTDIGATFLTGSPALPVYAGETQCKSLGMDARVFDEAGRDIGETGLAGEMVCTRPHPSLPLFLWGDNAQNDKYIKTYYNTYPGIWRQGDFIVMNPQTKGFKILGRSDGVLNPSGVRFGAAEIYSVLEPFFSGLIADGICVGQKRAGIDEDERVLLFVKMREKGRLDDTLVREMKDAVRRGLSRRHVPEYIIEVDDIPYTSTGKRIEIAVKEIVSGSATNPSGAVVNPESLEQYYKYFRELGPVRRALSKL
ncbi:acetoacetyl-CoA synthetase [Mycena amicta]|nr:acetoacetyl-CoA synthetase [Mycena amicta]